MDTKSNEKKDTSISNKMPLMEAIAIVIFALLVFGAFVLSNNRSPNTAPDSTGNDQGTAMSVAYTNTTANIRTCAAPTCDVVGTYPPNTSIDISAEDVSDVAQLPDWISFSYSNADGSTATGYISKSVLSDTEVPVANTPQPIAVPSQVSAPAAQTTDSQYNTCIAEATTNYNQAWASACASQYSREQQQYAQCYQEYGDLKNYCNQMYPGRLDGSARCSLEGNDALQLNSGFTSDKDRCVAAYH
jgi:hypothetical protein